MTFFMQRVVDCFKPNPLGPMAVDDTWEEPGRRPAIKVGNSCDHLQTMTTSVFFACPDDPSSHLPGPGRQIDDCSRRGRAAHELLVGDGVRRKVQDLPGQGGPQKRVSGCSKLRHAGLDCENAARTIPMSDCPAGPVTAGCRRQQQHCIGELATVQAARLGARQSGWLWFDQGRRQHRCTQGRLGCRGRGGSFKGRTAPCCAHYLESQNRQHGRGVSVMLSPARLLYLQAVWQSQTFFSRAACRRPLLALHVRAYQLPSPTTSRQLPTSSPSCSTQRFRALIP